MGEETYFTIFQGDGGPAAIEEHSRESLEKMLEDGDFGEDVKILEKLPLTDNGCLEVEGLVIIRGCVVVPKKVERVIRVKLP